jgi:hypothetical protein
MSDEKRIDYNYDVHNEDYFDALSDAELVALGRQLNSDLCLQKRDWIMRIPVTNGCPDTIFGAVLDRLASKEGVKE